jgi:hypothetical protein
LYEQRRRQDALQERVQELSVRYLQAQEAAADEAMLKRISEELAACLAKYEAAQRRHPEGRPPSTPRGEASPPVSPSSPPWDLVPFLEAEDEHNRRFREAEDALADVSRRLAAAKGRYRDALRGLEVLSAGIHRQRATETVEKPSLM